MKILVLSDSHSTLWFMKRCVEAVNPNAIVHLGDHYDDAEVLAKLRPMVPLYQVPGNCDVYRCPFGAPIVLNTKVCGVRLYMTHGHNHGVKQSTYSLCEDARKAGAAAALYGHTHQAHCEQLEDGLWLLNPGSAGNGGRTAAIIETDGTKITACRIVGEADLEETV